METDVSFPSNGLKLAGRLYTPDDRTAGRLPAIVISNSWGAVKEQSSTVYAKRLAHNGLAALVFDPAHYGESEGEPRYLESPYQRAEDIRNAVTYLATRDDVDAERIGAVGLAVSGGYVPYAAQTDHRIKAVATISAVDMGGLFRDGLDGKQDKDVIRGMLAEVGRLRTREAMGEAPALEKIVPDTLAEAQGLPAAYREATEYFRTPRGQHPRSVNRFVLRSVEHLAQYDSYALNSLISPRPLLLIEGGKSDTKRFSELAMDRAGEPKELFLVDGASHMDLADKDEYVSVAVAKLTEFFGTSL